VTPNTLIAATLYVPWNQMSDVGKWLIVGFGMLLWMFLILGLLYIGMHSASVGRSKRTKQKRDKHEERRVQPCLASNIRHRERGMLKVGSGSPSRGT